MTLDKYHLTKDNDEWKLKKEGNQNASLKAETKKQAVKDMQDFMKDKTGSVRIHKTNGRIQEERTYQRRNDPRRSKG